MVYYLLDFEATKEKTVDMELKELQSMILTYSDSEILYSEKEKISTGWFSSKYDVTAVISGSEDMYADVKSRLVGSDVTMNEVKELSNTVYSFKTYNNYSKTTIESFQNSLVSDLNKARDKVNNHLGWNLQTTVISNPRRPDYYYVGSVGMNGSIKGDVKEVIGAKQLIEKNGYNIGLSGSSIVFS